MEDRIETSENINELRQYLNGLEEGMDQAFFHLAEIIKAKAFELCLNKENGDCLIPYMMNDAVEYYLILKNSRLKGEFVPKEKIVSVNLVKDGRYALVIRQENGTTCTVWFHYIEECVHCYQYHRIGHFWVSGQEHWRRLVYMTGTIFDKYQYLGAEFCNQQELEILHLMEFAPFRYWSPIHESLDAYYEDTEEGLAVMWKLAEEAGDHSYQRLIRWYRMLNWKWMTRFLGKRLLSPKRKQLYKLIEKKIEKASLEYPVRDYGDKQKCEMEEKRNIVSKRLQELGFAGTYPSFHSEQVSILAVEEHPYVLSDMEYEDFEFRIFLMIWENGKIKIQRPEEIQ